MSQIRIVQIRCSSERWIADVRGRSGSAARCFTRQRGDVASGADIGAGDERRGGVASTVGAETSGSFPSLTDAAQQPSDGEGLADLA